MNLRSYTRLLRNRWATVSVTTLAIFLAVVLATLLTTPLYQASTRLFVSTASGASMNELYQGNLFSQQRVISYTELIKGDTLAQRTIDKLGLEVSAAQLAENVEASAKLDTVLIEVRVLDASPVRARDIANTLSDEFVAFAQELETPADGSPPDARVVVEQRASIPEIPITPKTWRNIAIGLAVGLLLGVALAIIRDHLDNTVKDRETLEHVSQVGLVGAIPLDRDRRTQPAISFDRDSSAIAEAFRKLRTNLQFLSVDNPPRLLVVASSLPGEGKSTTAINIGLALAEAGHNVVIVDGDMRRPMLSNYLDVVGVVGFSTVLSGRASVAQALQKTMYAGLTVLTAGAIPPNPSELLGSLAAKRVLAELRAEFDYVVIDSSPLLAVTDAAILAANADGVLLIARYGHTSREQLAQAVKNLADVDAALLGAVLTMTPVRGNAIYGYGYYGDHQKTRQQSDPAEQDVVNATVNSPRVAIGEGQDAISNRQGRANGAHRSQNAPD